MIVDHTMPTSPLGDDPWTVLSCFHANVYACFERRADTLCELAEAVACASTPVQDLAHLSLEAEHRRGHGALYDALNAGHINLAGLRAAIAAGPVPKITGPDGRARIVLAVDVSNWLRPDATTSPQRSFCHTYPRGRGHAQMIPGWAYSFVAALEPGPTSWTSLLDVARVRPDADATALTARQIHRVVTALNTAGHHRAGDPKIVVVCDAGYNVHRLAWLLSDLPVTIVGRVRSDRVFHAPPGRRKGPTKGRPPRHGDRLVLRDHTTHPSGALRTVNHTIRYGQAEAVAFARMHPRLDARSGWHRHDGPLPIIEGTVIGLEVERLPGERDPKPVWLWASEPVPADAAEVDHWWSLYLRRFDLEHTFRFLKQTLGWTKPRLRSPEAADRWTWLVITAHTTLRLARPLAVDNRLPWQRALTPSTLTPARVRAGYRRVHAKTPRPSRPPKPSHPGPGRPKGSRNRTRAPIQTVGKG